MATFNGEKFLSKQLESLAAQHILPDELVICDDKSTDGTIQLLNDFSKKVSFPIRILQNQKNMGFVTSFNTAIEATKGDLVFLCDQDDYWFPHKISYTLEIAKNHPDARLFMNNAELTDGKLTPSGFTTFGQMIAAGQDPKGLVLGCCMAIRRELLELCLPIPGQFSAHDIWLNEFSMLFESKHLFSDVLQYYRRHQKNETTHIVYSLKRINKWDYRVDFYRRLIFGKTNASLSRRILDNTLRISSLELLISKADLPHRKKLELWRDRVGDELVSLRERLEIIKNGFFLRFYYSFRYLVKGGYHSGLKSFLKDLLAISN
jgi:glycosyltransferase involved in cell wall biosynthesis